MKVIETVNGTVRCKRHPYYRGLRAPRVECDICLAMRQFNIANGVKETRKVSKENA